MERIYTKIYEDDFFLYDAEEKKWVNLNKKYSKQSSVEAYLKGFIHRVVFGSKPGIKQSKINNYYNSLRNTTFFDETVEKDSIEREMIVFKNGYYDKDGFHEHDEGDEPIFSPFQIERDFKVKVNENNSVKNFIWNYAMKDETNYKFLIEQIGLAMMPLSMSMMVIHYSKHSTSGKGTFVELVKRTIGNNVSGQIDHKKLFGGSSNFSMSPFKGKTFVSLDELPPQLNHSATETIKDLVDDKDRTQIERKGVDPEEILLTFSMIATTNHVVGIHNVDDAIRKRLIFYHAKMNEDKDYVFTTTEIKNILKDEEGIDWLVNEACKAIFEVNKRTGIRAERFTIPKSNSIFWNRISSRSVAIEVIESSESLYNLMEAQDDFIPNELLKEEFTLWKNKNSDEKVSFKGFKKELESFFSNNSLGKINIDARKKSIRGVSIEWDKEWGSMYIEETEEEAEETSKDNKTMEEILELLS